MKILKGQMPRCAWCGAPWQQVFDPNYIPGDSSSRSKSASRPYQEPLTSAPWHQQNHPPNAVQWNTGSQNTQRPRSRRHRGRGRGQHRDHPETQGLTPVATLPPPPPIPIKGDGKGYGNAVGQYGQGILSPPPAPATLVAQMPSSLSNQAVGHPDVTRVHHAGGETAMYAPTPAQPSEAEVRLQSLLKELRQAPEESLTPGLQAEMQKNARRDDKIMNKGLETAVKELGHARRALSNVLAYRTKLVSDWRVFLQQSVITWREYTSMFQAQEQALQEKLTQANEALSTAKRNFHEQSQFLKEEEIQEITGEERDTPGADADMQFEATKRIHAGLTEVVDNLQGLAEKAEIEEQQAKRQKKKAEEEVVAADGDAASFPSMQPFGRPGNQ